MTEYRSNAKPLLYAWSDYSDLATSDTYYCLTPQQAAIVAQALYRQARWATRWIDSPNMDQIDSVISDAIYSLENPCSPPNNGGGGGGSFEHECIDVVETNEKIEICIRDCGMVPINVYISDSCGCGCGNGGNGGTTGGGDAIGGTGGGSSAGLLAGASRCDLVTTVVPYYIEQVREWLQAVDQQITNGATMVEALFSVSDDLVPLIDVTPAIVEDIAEWLRNSTDALINAFGDSDLILRTQENAWGRFTSDYYETFTRDDIRNLGKSLPVIWGQAFGSGTVSPRGLTDILSRYQPVNKFAQRLQIARGTADPARCAYLASTYGQEYAAPAPLLPPPATVINGYAIQLITQYDGTVVPDPATFDLGEFTDAKGIIAELTPTGANNGHQPHYAFAAQSFGRVDGWGYNRNGTGVTYIGGPMEASAYTATETYWTSLENWTGYTNTGFNSATGVATHSAVAGSGVDIDFTLGRLWVIYLA